MNFHSDPESIKKLCEYNLIEVDVNKDLQIAMKSVNCSEKTKILNFAPTNKSDLETLHALSEEINSYQCICCIDFNALDINGEEFYALITDCNIRRSSLSFIFYNIPSSTLQQAKEINDKREKKKSYRYWKNNCIITVYSFINISKNGSNTRFHFADILYGESEIEYQDINKTISNYHNNIETTFPINNTYIKGNNISVETKATLLKSGLFIEELRFLPFDLLFKSKNNRTIFEENSYVLLQNEISTEGQSSPMFDVSKSIESNLEKHIESFQGYKISNTHMKIGEKIHISDYYYAKRIFQNSYYAVKFAYLLSSQVISYIEKISKENIKQGLTLVGYGVYSELLLTYTTELLIDSKVLSSLGITRDDINHNYFENNLELVKNPESVKDNIFIVIPIASTFTTSSKVARRLSNIFKGSKKIYPIDYNIILVKEINKKAPCSISDLEKQFGWKQYDEDDDQTIIISRYFDYKEISQKFFLALPTQCFDIDNCHLCYPKKIAVIVNA